MEEMLVTWRTGSPSGKEVFGATSQMMLEKNIWGGGNGFLSVSWLLFVSNHSSQICQSSRKVQQTPPITKSQVLAELEVTLAQKERFATLNPLDSVVKNQVAVLYQVSFKSLFNYHYELTDGYSFVDLLSREPPRRSSRRSCSNFVPCIKKPFPHPRPSRRLRRDLRHNSLDTSIRLHSHLKLSGLTRLSINPRPYQATLP